MSYKTKVAFLRDFPISGIRNPRDFSNMFDIPKPPRFWDRDLEKILSRNYLWFKSNLPQLRIWTGIFEIPAEIKKRIWKEQMDNIKPAFMFYGLKGRDVKLPARDELYGRAKQEHDQIFDR